MSSELVSHVKKFVLKRNHRSPFPYHRHPNFHCCPNKFPSDLPKPVLGDSRSKAYDLSYKNGTDVLRCAR